MALFNYKTLAVAVGSMGLASTAYSAGLDRSGQDITAFLQDGTYAEAVYTYIDTNVAGHDNGVASGASNEANYIKGNATGNISETYDFFRYGVKADINDRFSVGVIYDEPFGAAIQHPNDGSSNFVSQGGDASIATLTAGTPLAALTPAQINGLASALQNPVSAPTAQATIAAQVTPLVTAQLNANPAFGNLSAAQKTAMIQEEVAKAVANTARSIVGVSNISTTAEAQKGQGTNVEIRTNNATVLMGAKFGPNNNFQVYGGPALQRLNGEVHLRGKAYQQATGYDASISTDTALGWVAGVAYSKPEIALKASLTYRSEIDHKTQIAEVFPALGAVNGTKTQDFEVTLPESYNLDFQTGVSPTMLLTAKVRYVPWSDFAIKPTLYTATTGTPIVAYDKDQWSGEIGLAKKINDKLAISGNVGYDSGAGNPVSTLGPVKGYHSVGLGAKYNLTKEWSISAGAKYLMFGDATAKLPRATDNIAGKFEDNDGVIAGVKLAYHSK